MLVPGGTLIEHAKRFRKYDLDRLGLFIEMPYLEGQYVSPFAKPKTAQGRNIMCRRKNEKCGTQDGFFDKTFGRIFEGEGIQKPQKGKAKKDIKPFVSGGCSKWHSCPGDFYGTFGGRIKAFTVSQAAPDELKKEAQKPKKEVEPKRPMITNPGKKGTYGFPNICLSKFPEYTYNNVIHVYGTKPKYKEYGKDISPNKMKTAHCPQPFFWPNPYKEEEQKPGELYIPPKERPHTVVGNGRWMPVGPSKWPGGCHGGTFSRFPEYISNRDEAKEAKEREAKLARAREQTAKTFMPQSRGLKTLLTSSILNRSARLRINCMNYKTCSPIYTKYLLG